MQIQCVKCKGRGFCGRTFCAIYAKSEAMFKVKKALSKADFTGTSPTPFVGHYGYPNVNVGILSPGAEVKDAEVYDAPKQWAKENFQIPNLVELRSALINSRFNIDIKKQSKMLEISKEVGMSAKPVDVEIRLDKIPSFRMNLDSYTAPMGPNAGLKNARITSNPKIPRPVEKVEGDTDMKARDAVLYLSKKEFDENFITRILSVGTIGMKKDRRLVPTRWSITATDDMIAKDAINRIKGYKQSDYLAFFGSYLGNYFLIMAFPEAWSYELFEAYMPKASWNPSSEISYMTDYEPYGGRKSYAENCAGGYYAARIGIAEKLDSMKRQASVLALRFITGEYAVPLGVWVVREAVRKAMASKPIEFASKELMLRYAEMLAKRKFGHDISSMLKSSVLLREIGQQKKLSGYF